ncbi:acyl-CoA dehydrogenase [Ketobacter sp. MCCC 1A13808]|uniref:acyl-CoA dehydrogenase C-terminal domain-containing protein n=1 Tax=Ketobacter sp. MCCC 1A13808 TaxID=2602738 RepID=UPI000F12F163|nr:acyl-CoA dehydrogenase C-terminal domain-containing protein [Ketobacter sp. MCCC 1A13808]MVF14167.1 acyl-CoA dehydrogenase [Ketobacter sp. MCCC 1A13808]RLP54076.1 MAG: acyl-CoA dehydrogenase [Ketobacter sp.]
MSNYQAPLQDMQFLLFDVFAVDQQWRQSPALASVLDRDTASAMLHEAGKIAGECVAPLNRSGDEEGVQWIDGVVTTPNGFKQAYDTFCESGFSALTGNTDYGGLGMPKSLSVLVDEMMYAANSSFNLYVALSSGASMALDAHGNEFLKQRFLPNLYSGRWGGTMCLTESHCGSDLGLIRSKAEDFGDGTYGLTGTKIFITGGDHDLSENIVHLVLAKLPGSPAGSRGISLFLVPKYWVNEDGTLGAANGVTCGSVEHKMGIKASATCVMNFDGARGYLVGEVNRGLQCMFTMMNCERLSIGIQGLGCAEASYQSAVAYARDRVQGREAGVKSTMDADPIIVHADVRRMLLDMKSTTEAGRAFAVYLGMHLDQAQYAPSAEARYQADAIVALLTPVAKAFFTDLGLDSTVLGQQVFGGHGYIREWGQEQLVRDVRIAQIYEGTNGIQAMDLIQRKVFANQGESLKTYLHEIRRFLQRDWQGEQADFADQLQQRVAQLSELTEVLLQRAQHSPYELGAAACDYLHVVGYVTYGYMWMKMLSACAPNTASHLTKQKTGAYYFKRVLPRVDSLIASIQSGSDPVMSLLAEEF